MKAHQLAVATLTVGLVAGLGLVPIATHAAGAKVATAPVPVPVNANVKEGNSCAGARFQWAVLGKFKNGKIGYVRCYGSVFIKADGLPLIDQRSRKPIISASIPTKSTFGYAPYVYITPQKITAVPKTSITASSEFSNLETCRLAEADYSGRPNMASGFPIPAERAVVDSELIVQVVPSDFADVRSKGNPAKDISDATQAVSDFYSRMSDGKVKVTWRIPKQYFSLAKKAADYGMGDFRAGLDGYWQYADDAIANSDKSIDFTGADVVAFVTPPTITDKQMGGFIAEAAMPNSSTAVVTDEKTIHNNYIVGGDQVRDPQNWIHEFGHMLGLSDGGGSSGGSNLGFDVMYWYGNPELSIWHRYLLGITDPKNINCVKAAGTSTHWIRPVESNSAETKGVVIPLSKNKAIVIESRRRLGYDALLGQESQGALVYLVDTTKSGNEGSAPFTVIAPSRMTLIAQWSLDAPLKLGESVSSNGWKISVVETGNFGDVIKIEKG